jgi:hypothetical protein
MVAMIAGTVMPGPVPTMFDMLIEAALSSPKAHPMAGRMRRGRGGVAELVNADSGFCYGQPEYCNRQIEAGTLSGSKRLALH